MLEERIVLRMPLVWQVVLVMALAAFVVTTTRYAYL